jgi:RHS repeat-associated protein
VVRDDRKRKGMVEQNNILISNPFRYRGYYYDPETKLYYLNSRYYDPETSRFINADDPNNLLTESMMPSGANLYQYCYNNPVMYTDSSSEGLHY